VKIVSIDASAAAAWLFHTQRTEAADQFLSNATDHRFVAPSIFAWEIGNLIALRARGNTDETDRLVDVLASFSIEIAPPVDFATVFGLVGQAARQGLTLFDSAYLSHALEFGAGLASRDRRLLDAARAVGVDVFDLRG